MQFLSLTLSLLRPKTEHFSERLKAEVQIHRLLSILGMVLVPAFGLFYGLTNPDAVDPTWARVAIALLFAVLLAASYQWRWVCRRYVIVLRGIVYLLIGWFAVIASLNQFVGDYAIGLLLVFAVLLAVMGVGAHTLQPAIRFSGAGIGVTAVAMAIGPTPESSPLILFGSLATVALIGSLAIRAHLKDGRRIHDRESRLRSLVNSVRGVVFQLRVSQDGDYQVRFVSDRAKTVLGLASDRDGFFDRFINRIPSRYREAALKRMEEAVAAKSLWNFEVPFKKQPGEHIWLLIRATPERQGKKLVLNGVILDITERKKTEQALADRQEKMESLYTATSLLLTANSRDAVADRTYGLLQDIFDFPKGNVGLIEEGMMVPKGGTFGDDPDPEPWTSVIAESSLGVRASESGETVVVENTASSNVPVEASDVQSVAAVPLGEHGAIVVGRRESGGFDSFDLRLLEVLASYVTVVLDRLNGDRNRSGVQL